MADELEVLRFENFNGSFNKRLGDTL